MVMKAGYRGAVALLSMALMLSAAAIGPALSARQAPGNAGSSGSPDLPLYFIIDSTLGAHEQDIKDRIFEYEVNAAKNDPALQSSLIQRRSAALKSDIKDKKSLLSMLLSRGDMMRREQLAAVAEEMNTSIEKLDGRSRKLEERASALGAHDGKKAYTDIDTLMMDLGDMRGLVSSLSWKAYNSGPSGNGNKK